MYKSGYLGFTNKVYLFQYFISAWFYHHRKPKEMKQVVLTGQGKPKEVKQEVLTGQGSCMKTR